MRRRDNPELKNRILKHLADKYNIMEVREPGHLSSYVTCRTKAFLDQKQTAEPTEQEVMLFSIGYGLQDVLTPKDASAPVLEKYGIIYRPDMTFLGTEELVGRLVEVKTTRKSAKNHFMDEFLPLTWLDYMKGGCYIAEKTEYDLIILYMMGSYSPPFPQIYAETDEFDDDEIDEAWNRLMSNKAVLDTALELGEPPAPFQNCYDWECQYCRYKLVCQTLDSVGDNVQAEKDKELWD